MFTTTLGLLYGELNRRIGYRNARKAMEEGETGKLYEEISDYLESFNQSYDFMENLEQKGLDADIVDTPQKAMVYQTARNPSGTGRFYGQRKAILETPFDLEDLRELDTEEIVSHLDGREETGAVSMADTPSEVAKNTTQAEG